MHNAFAAALLFSMALPVLEENYDRRQPAGAAERIISRTLADLRSVASRNSIGGDEEASLRRATEHLERFQTELSRNARCDRGRIMGAVEHVAHLSQAESIRPDDRSVLLRDLLALRELHTQNGSGS